MIVGGPGDEAAAAPLRHAFAPERRIDLVGRADLLTAYAALQGADLFVGADSGLTHLAAAAGAPTLALFGPSDERLYAPWGPGARAMRGPRPFEDFLRLDPRLDGSLPHMEDLSLARVVAEAEALLKAHRAEPAHA
jgi:ADP-heptose:LPS heptosyltransferase